MLTTATVPAEVRMQNFILFYPSDLPHSVAGRISSEFYSLLHSSPISICQAFPTCCTCDSPLRTFGDLFVVVRWKPYSGRYVRRVYSLFSTDHYRPFSLSILWYRLYICVELSFFSGHRGPVEPGNFLGATAPPLPAILHLFFLPFCIFYILPFLRLLELLLPFSFSLHHACMQIAPFWATEGTWHAILQSCGCRLLLLHRLSIHSSAMQYTVRATVQSIPAAAAAPPGLSTILQLCAGRPANTTITTIFYRCRTRQSCRRQAMPTTITCVRHCRPPCRGRPI